MNRIRRFQICVLIKMAASADKNERQGELAILQTEDTRQSTHPEFRKGGGNHISTELLKGNNNMGEKAIYILLSSKYDSKKKSWQDGKSNICTIYKKGDKRTCVKQRAISLISSACKVLIRTASEVDTQQKISSSPSNN